MSVHCFISLGLLVLTTAVSVHAKYPGFEGPKTPPIPKERPADALEYADTPVIERLPAVKPVLDPSDAVSIDDDAVSPSPETTEDEEDEMVAVRLESAKSGGMRLKFRSHGREVDMDLEESPMNMSQIPFQFMGLSPEQNEKVRTSLKDIRMMSSVKHGATVAVKVDANGKVEPLIQSGAYRLGPFEFTLNKDGSSRDDNGRVRISKRHVNQAKHEYDGIEVDLGRMKRQMMLPATAGPQSAVVELVILADNAVYQKYCSDGILPDTSVSAYVNLLIYIAHMSEIVNSHYSNMQNYDINIRVALTGIYVLTSRYSYSDLVENLKERRSDGSYVVEREGALQRLASLRNSSNFAIPSGDHLMLLTGYNLYDSETESDNILGTAYTASICHEHYSVSVVENTALITAVAHVAAQALGHSLGAHHDASVGGGSEACSDYNYIMSAKADSSVTLSHKFLFSCCSQRSFYATVSSVQCLGPTTRAPNYNSDVSNSVDTYLPGQIFSADDQCYMAVGTNACPLDVLIRHGINVCQRMYCIKPGDSSQCNSLLNHGAADGTECGDNSWCYKGECIRKNTVRTTLDQHCNVRDCYGTERRCTSGTNIRVPGLFQCYQSRNQCDGISDCIDGSDESSSACSCPSSMTRCVSGISKYRVPEGVPQICVHNSWVCDGAADCTDGSDEFNCS